MVAEEDYRIEDVSHELQDTETISVFGSSQGGWNTQEEAQDVSSVNTGNSKDDSSVSLW